MSSVLNSLFRFFQPVPLPASERGTPPPAELDSEQHLEVDKGKEKQREMPAHEQPRAADEVPLERKTSFFSLDRSVQGPPHIAWVIPTPSPTPVGGSPAQSHRSWPPKPGNRASTPLSSMEGPSSAATGTNGATGASNLSGGQQRAANRPTSEGLRLLSMYYLGELISESETSSTNASISLNKPLPSPGDPGVQFPPADPKTPVESVPLTPDSTRLPTPSTPGFLTRPLKRTISQTSTSTFGTPTSLTAPSIPPLDLRPNFSGSLGVPARRSQLAAPSLPTVIGSPRPQVSVIYEDSDPADSFRTALSVRISIATDGDLELGRNAADDPFADPADAGGSDDGASWVATHSRTDLTTTEQSHMSISEDAYDEIDLGVPEADPEREPMHADTETQTQTQRRTPPSPMYTSSVLETMSRRSHGSDDTVVESAIKRRWVRGLSFGSYRTDRGTWEPRTRTRLTSACALFWLGFVAPWCWLIGGWYLSPSGEMKPDGQFVDTVKWRWPRRRRATWKSHARSKGHLLPFWRSKHQGKSPEAMPMSPVDSTRSVKSLDLLKSGGKQSFIDPWVKRCRVAAVSSGILLAVAVVIALIVVAGVLG